MKKKKKNNKIELHEPLALQHRPKELSDLIGQEAAVSQIFGMFKKKRMSRSFLITGPLGSGKTSIARLIAKYANCENFNHKEVRPCNECYSCKTFTSSGIKGNHDIHEINGGEERGINDVRNIKKNSRYLPRGNFRIYIIDECHKLTKDAQGAFLKPLEEPPKHTIFIMVTTDPEMLLPTIRSRCKPLQIKHLREKEICKLLRRVSKKEGCLDSLNKDIFKKIAMQTDNHPRDALQVLDNVMDVIGSGEEIKDINVEKLAQTVTGAPPWQIVGKFLFSIYQGSYAGALKSALDIENADYFMKSVLKYHNYALYSSLLPGKYYNKSFYYFDKEFKSLVAKEKIIINNKFKMAMANTMEEFVSTASDIKSYLVEGNHLVSSCIAKVVPDFKYAKK